MSLVGLVLMLAGSQTASSQILGPVASPEAACSRAMEAYTAAYVQPLSTSYCDVIPDDAEHPELYVLALRSGRECDDICSDLMGWFAVKKATGRVYHWEVGEQRLEDELLPSS